MSRRMFAPLLAVLVAAGPPWPAPVGLQAGPVPPPGSLHVPLFKLETDPKAPAKEGVGIAATFHGTWRGKGKTSTGETADVTLRLKEGAWGALSGEWLGDIPLRGERLGRDTFYFEAVSKVALYRAVGALDEPH